jgi:Uma2 family endonuclease
MSTVSTATQLKTVTITGNHVVQIPDVSWATYKKLDDERGEQRGIPFTYSEGVLQIMANGRAHERLSANLTRLVELLAEEFELDFDPCGSTTLRREDLEKGFEPDSCFYIANAALMRAKKEIDLAIDPPPDLTLEIDITSSSLNRLPIFAAVGIPEVWRYENGAIKIYQLQGEIYNEADESMWFPQIKAAQLARWLAMSWDMPRLQWVKAVRVELEADIS